MRPGSYTQPFGVQDPAAQMQTVAAVGDAFFFPPREFPSAPNPGELNWAGSHAAPRNRGAPKRSLGDPLAGAGASLKRWPGPRSREADSWKVPGKRPRQRQPGGARGGPGRRRRGKEGGASGWRLEPRAHARSSGDDRRLTLAKSRRRHRGSARLGSAGGPGASLEA